MKTSIFRLFCPAVLLSLLTVLPNLAQQVDLSFGTNGWVSTNFSGASPNAPNNDEAVKAFNLPDGKILVVANHKYDLTGIGSFYTMRLVRYTNVGVPDGPPGNNSGTIAARDAFIATNATMQPDGKIVVVGYTYNPNHVPLGDKWAIARYNQNGTPDTTPSGQEWYVTRLFGIFGLINDVKIQPDGKIVVVGYAQDSANNRLTIVGRYNSDAEPDVSFGPYGNGFFDLYDNTALSKRLVIQPNGKILLGGSYYPDAYLASYNTNGTQDTTFGAGGYVRLDYSGDDSVNDLQLQPDGKILVLVSSWFWYSSILARFNPDGSKDLSFTPNGAVFLDTSATHYPFMGNSPPTAGGYEYARSIIQRSNGNIVVAGYGIQLIFSASPRRQIFSAIEYDTNGRLLNQSFSRHSREEQVLTRTNLLEAAGAIEQPDGKILFYGKISESAIPTIAAPYNVALARYSSIAARKDANLSFDYDFDDKSEFAVFRPNNNGLGNWYFLTNGEFTMRQYGAPGDILVPGDYDGGGMADMGVFRPATGEWFTKTVYTNNCPPMTCGETIIQFGASGDIPAPGDFDGDGMTDRAVFRPSGGDWYILFSSGGFGGIHFGQNGDQPVTGDYDGDGKSDIAVIRRENGNIFWYILQSSDNQFVGLQFGLSEDKTVIADYNADAKTDIAVWRPSNGTWYLLTNYTDFSATQFGAQGDIPEPFDYDRDRKADFAVFRPDADGVHYILKTSDGSSLGVQFGAATDTPIAAAYVR
jgi:uncharacterized delta-60 repeat protein